jgi:hypothetical protein
MADVYTNQSALQDIANDPSSASYTQTLTITNGGRLSIDLKAAEDIPWINDLDLYLLHDADMSGTFNWGTEIVAASFTPGVKENIQVDFPADGNYMIAVHGAQVPEPPFLFDLTIEAVDGADLALSGLPIGPVSADSQIILALDWSKTVLPGEIWRGLVVLGTPLLPSALTVPVYILPCDPTGLVAEADFSHNGPLILGSTAVFSNSSSGAPPLSYQWNFGDGSGISTEENPTHLYNVEGAYSVTLTTTNDFSSDTIVQSVYVGLETVAGFVHNGPIYAWQTAVFTNSSTGSPPLTYLWNFDDGFTSTAENPTHFYADPGAYSVMLTVTNVFGMDMSVQTIEIQEALVFMPVVLKS